MTRWLTGFLAAGCFLISQQAADAAAVVISKDIYQWVQSTARASYYFNKQAICYGVDRQGIIDMNTLIVPAVLTYDNIQIQDVMSKRRWNMVSTEGYENLVGAADYLVFRLKEGTVQVTEHQDLDSKWGVLDRDKSGKEIKLDSFSEKSVEGKFYRTILEYEKGHQEEIVKHTKGTLSKEDAEKLEKAKKERAEQEKKALKEKEKQEKAERKEREKREKAERKAQKEREKKEKAEQKVREKQEKQAQKELQEKQVQAEKNLQKDAGK